MKVYQSSALGELKNDKANLQRDVKNGEKKLQVRPGLCQSICPILTWHHWWDAQARVQDLCGKASSSRQKAEEAKASQAASTSQNKVLDSLSRPRSAGRINGFRVSIKYAPVLLFV